MRSKQGELIEIVKKSKGGEDNKIDDAFDAVLDYDALARETLKEAWAERTEASAPNFSRF
ncbi:MAG: hypothetical protein QM756_30610 [Polyangiaceae bacterium]